MGTTATTGMPFPRSKAASVLDCSYCEGRIATKLGVEHIQMKDDNLDPELEGSWDKCLLGCVNFNIPL